MSPQSSFAGPNHANQPTQINVQNPAKVFAAASISVPEIGHKSTTGRKYSASRSLQWRIPYGHQRLNPLLHLIVWYFDTTYVGPRSISGVSHPAKLKILWQRRLDQARVSSTTANALACHHRLQTLRQCLPTQAACPTLLAATTLTVCSDAPARVFTNGPTPGALQGDDYPLEYYEDGYPKLPACLDRRAARCVIAF